MATKVRTVRVPDDVDQRLVTAAGDNASAWILEAIRQKLVRDIITTQATSLTDDDHQALAEFDAAAAEWRAE